MNPQTILINEFLSKKEIAIAGASRDFKKFGYKVLFLLKSNGFQLYPIHPEASEIEGLHCYKSARDIPQNVRHLLILTPAKATDKVMIDAVSRGYDMIWIQQQSETPTAIDLAKKNKIKLITNRCIFMFVDPQGGHKFHRFMLKLVGKI